MADYLFRVRRQPSILVYAGADLCLGDDNHLVVVPGVEEHLRALFERLKNNITPVTKLVYLWGLDNYIGLTMGAVLQDTVSRTGVYTIVQLLNVMSRYRSMVAARLWLVTRGSQVKEKMTDGDLLQYPVWAWGDQLHRKSQIHGAGCWTWICAN